MKRLFIMRHAKADDHFSGSDLSRPLTKEGIQVQNQMAQFLKKNHFEIEGILYSPYERAQKSAEIVHQNYPKAHLYKEPALGSVFDSYTILKRLEEKPFQSLMIVGHAPTLSIFGQSLLAKPRALPFEKSAVAILEFKDFFQFGKGELLDLFSPNEIHFS